ncbi:uncharacterized protein LOC131548983 isoform X5 [Onychostoma macrolepis]|uniref:uncharacterized protein LOC131548983 isoform X5 n=1 Tax=Onychostoma macrolepis TaxID=369639 RepID=UPI00272A819D|nr:uncharacterized protein LOC131548983 isoform X5 [Onychostoma macrolepis]
MSLYNVKGFILTKKLSLCSAAYIYNLYLMYCYLKIYCISATAFSDQFRVTASSASVQKDSSTAQMRHDARDTPSDLSENERPDIRVSYDSQTVLEYEFSNNLKSVENKVVSCSYSPKNAPSKQSYSEKFNLTVFFPVKIQSPPTTKGTLYSTPTFNATTNSTTTEPKAAVATESSSCCETTINPTTETIHPSQLLSVIRNTTPVSTPGENAVHTPTTKTWLILTMATTSTGIFLTGLMGICLCCIRLQPRKKSPVNTSVAAISQTPDDIDAREEHSEENGMKLDHVYCTIPDVAADTHVLYSLAQMPNHPLPV